MHSAVCSQGACTPSTVRWVYKKLLHTTPIASVEDAALVAGIDLTKKDFWEKSICSYEKLVDEFETLARRVYNF